MIRFLSILIAALVLVGSASAEKRIALTFDDAPRGDGPVLSGAMRTDMLVRRLFEARAVPSAFFVTTKGFEEGLDGVERIETYAAAGHLIANHSHSHPWLHQTDVETYLADIDEAERRLARFENRRPWFRYPFLDEGRQDVEKRDAVREALAERGLMSGYVTVDTYDWHIDRRWRQAAAEGKSVNLAALREVYVSMIVDAAEHYDAMAEEWLDRQPAHVLLLHENDLAALFIGDAVKALRQAGWEIISPDEAYDDPIADELPETTFSGMGRVAALAADRGASGAEVFDHWSADEAAIDAKLEERGVFSD
ncbi:polysaccharide deacetylase family protein [Parvularcula lutaonensis]|uniref:Chitooligosaccharide deacetylase n=1 Tax=Parvularcula lutaonensis TaxID=491923 RepID=A0ABV7MA63_9PROT|nr:polysaccharide deacetylase family protein [Parvularcula lutaonensis]GGY36605.1 polysaccharide deacetylase [Parvularcula lutaonensis]